MKPIHQHKVKLSFSSQELPINPTNIRLSPTCSKRLYLIFCLQLAKVFPALWKSAETFSNFPFTSVNPEVNKQAKKLLNNKISDTSILIILLEETRTTKL